MSLPLKTLCTENDNQFKLSLQAGGNGFRNAVTWVHMIEDACIIPYFHGSELAVTTCIKTASDPLWLNNLVHELKGRGAAGLVVNTGKYIFDIPQEVLQYCEEQEFPLLTMPWEIHVTEMLQTFCTRIIQERSESVLFDKALEDALFKRGSEEEYREILSRYYDLGGKFTVILIHISRIDENIEKMQGFEYVFINRIRRFKTIDEILAPIEGDDAKHQGYMELLQAYIQNDRSLERTAAALYLHRNTVNYRIQKMKTLLDSPLKTVEDLFPYQVALAIRDMDIHSRSKSD